VDASVPFMLNYRYMADRSALMNDQRVIDESGRYHAVSYYQCTLIIVHDHFARYDVRVETRDLSSLIDTR